MRPPLTGNRPPALTRWVALWVPLLHRRLHRKNRKTVNWRFHSFRINRCLNRPLLLARRASQVKATSNAAQPRLLRSQMRTLYFKPRALLSQPVSPASARQRRPKVQEPLCRASGRQHPPFRTGTRPLPSIRQAISLSVKMPEYAGNALRISGRGRLSRSISHPPPR